MIYLVKDSTATGDDKYNEYIYSIVEGVGEFEKIGDTSFTINVATTTTAGIVKPDGETITVDNDGTIHAAPSVEFDEEDFNKEDDIVSLSPSQRIFYGTQAQWDALSTAVKKTYGQANITDDESAIGHIKSKTFSGTSDSNGFLLIDDDFYSNKVAVLGVHYPSGTPPYRIVPLVSTNGNKWFLNVGDLLTGESLANVTITNAVVYYVEL